jgi:hypothetical protein
MDRASAPSHLVLRLPFRFGGQTQAGPLAVWVGIIPGNLDDRVVAAVRNV